MNPRILELTTRWRERAQREHERGNRLVHGREPQSYCYGAEHAFEECAKDLEEIIDATPRVGLSEKREIGADEARLEFTGSTIDTQRLRIVTAHLSDLCGDFVCVYHTGGDNSVESMLLTNAEARYVLSVLGQIVNAWRTPKP